MSRDERAVIVGAGRGLTLALAAAMLTGVGGHRDEPIGFRQRKPAGDGDGRKTRRHREEREAERRAREQRAAEFRERLLRQRIAEGRDDRPDKYLHAAARRRRALLTQESANVD